MLFIQAATKCIWRVASEASGAFGILFTVAGSAAEALGWKAVMPNGGWIAIGAGLLFITACKIEKELMDERNRNSKPVPSVSLQTLVTRLAGGEDRHEEGINRKTLEALKAIRQEGRLGRLAIFGRTDAVEGHEDHYPLGPVNGDYWETAQISYLDYIQNPKCKTEAAKNPKPSTYFSDLHFDKFQIEAIWPSPKPRRFTFRNPIVMGA
jgi:hypothetical protein